MNAMHKCHAMQDARVSQHPVVLIAKRADRPLMRGQRAAKRAQTNKRQHIAHSKYVKAYYSSSILSTLMAEIVIYTRPCQCFSNRIIADLGDPSRFDILKKYNR